MARVTPEEYAEKWGRRLSGATEDIRRGISRVQVAPGQVAVQHQDKLVARFNESVTSGRWAQATRAVSLGDWQAKAIDKGVARIGAGVASALPQQAQMAQRLLAAVDASAAKARALPSTTIDDNINRAATFMREMSKSKGRIKTG